jgi:O-antigen/teichoic acid export membrane protein
MAGIRRSLLLASGERYAWSLINFATVVISARVLTPADFGVVVLGSTAAGLAESLREFGASTFLIQEPRITGEKVRTAFTIMLLLSFLLSATLFLFSSYVAAFYGDQALVPYLRLTALGLMFGPFASPILSLLRREMAFGKLALLNIVGASVNTVAVVTLALLGYRYMSFAWASLFSGVLGVLLALWVRPDVSIFRPSLREWRKAITFAGYDSTTVILNRLWEALPYVILGRVLGVDAVGLFSRAAAVCSWPERYLLAGLGPVALPAFSTLVREGRSLKVAYLKAIEYITCFLWPALTLLAIFAPSIVPMVLGNQWTAAVPLVHIMSVALFAWFPAYLTYPTLVASGGIRDTLTASLISLPLSAFILASASRYGLGGVALSMLVTVPLQVLVAVAFVRRRVGLTWTEMLRAVRKSFIVAASSGIAPLLLYGASHRFDSTTSLGTLLIGVCLSLSGWLLGLRLTRHPVFSELQRATEKLRADFRGQGAYFKGRVRD